MNRHPGRGKWNLINAAALTYGTSMPSALHESDDGVSLVLNGPAPENGVVERLDAKVFYQWSQRLSETLGPNSAHPRHPLGFHLIGLVIAGFRSCPPSLDEHQATTGAQQSAPAAQCLFRGGQGP